MADRVNLREGGGWGRALLAALLGLAPAFVLAQGALADPTRPPAGVESAGPGSDGGGSLLQSVLIPKKGRPVAVIGGQTVKLGEKYGDSTLIKVSEREVVLEGADGVERLLLTPAVEKTNVVNKKTPVRQARERGTP